MLKTDKYHSKPMNTGAAMVLLAVGIPLEAIAILLVIERPLDTIRTAVNVEGDLIGSLVVKSRLS